MSPNYVSLLIFIVTSSTLVSCARILCIAPLPSYSHQIVYRPIWERLAKNGHDLVVLTTDPWPQNYTNLKQIDWSDAYKLWRDEYKITERVDECGYNLWKIFDVLNEVNNLIADRELSHPEVIKMFNNKSEYFDLVIVEYAHPTMFPFSNYFNCPFVGILSLDLPSIYHSILGNPTHPLLYPDFLSPYDSDSAMTLKERFTNTIVTMLVTFYQMVRNNEQERRIVEKYFGENVPELIEITKNVSLVLANTHPVLNKRPLGPITVAFGGAVQLQPQKPLPKDISRFLDGAKNGGIYFSLGTNVNEMNVKPEMQQMFLNTFKQLPYRVLWKFNIDIPDVPENVKIVKWLPQQDVLRHPNVKLFITQGGLQSTEEAIFLQVPLVVIPFFADQQSNGDRMMRRGVGLALNRDELTETLLKETIEEVIENPKYKSKMVELAALSRDQPISGVDKAVWWIEYVLRHKGARHLRNEVAMHMPWYQYLLLDVFAVLFIIMGTFIYICWKILQFLYRKMGFSTRKLKKN